jgi:hypothetical protein
MCFSKAEIRFKPAMTARDISRRPEERQSAEVVEHGGAEREEDGGSDLNSERFDSIASRALTLTPRVL